MDYAQEQLLVIMTTTLSLLTAWSWNSVLQQYIHEYYGSSLRISVIAALSVTLITFLLVKWLLINFKIREKRVDKVHKTTLKNYVIESLKNN